ncbi:MAG: hypothetical protein AAGG11_23820 [Pseudomonadota bacterium]
MNKVTWAAIALMSLFVAPLAGALTTNEEFILYQMTQGKAEQLRAAARGIVESGTDNSEVLDPLAEIMLQNYTRGGDYIDAIAWAARAFTEAGNVRYVAALKEVAGAKGNRKVRGAAKKAAKALGDPGQTAQYQKGSVDLDALKQSSEAAYARMLKNLKAPEGMESIGIVEVGMSQSQIFARCGQPTSTTAYITGKSFIPFNFRGRDTVRTLLLYKGQGRIVVANNSAYTSNASAIEVIIDPSEVGYR